MIKLVNKKWRKLIDTNHPNLDSELEYWMSKLNFNSYNHIIISIFDDSIDLFHIFSSTSSIIFFIMFKLLGSSLHQWVFNFVFMITIIFSHRLNWGDKEGLSFFDAAFPIEVYNINVLRIEELSKTSNVFVILNEFILRNFHRSQVNHVKIVLIGFDHVFIPSTLFYINATQNGMAHEMVFVDLVLWCLQDSSHKTPLRSNLHEIHLYTV